MKKNFIILTFLFMITPTFVNAEKVYTKEYYFEGRNPIDYPYKSEEFKMNIYQSEEKLEEHKDRILLKEENDYIYNSLSFRYIVINGFEFDIKPHLSEVEILNNNELVTYTYTCTRCYGPAITNLNNGRYYADVDRSTYSDFTMTIDLGNIYNPDDIDIIVSFTNPLRDIINTKYNIWFLKDKPNNVERETTFGDAVIYKNHLAVNENKQEEYTNFPIDITEEDIINKAYDNPVSSKEEKITTFYEFVKGKTYTYQDKVFKYYKIVNNDKKIIKEKIKNTNSINKLDNNHVESNNAYKIVDISYNDNYKNQKKESTLSKEKITIKEDMSKLSNNVYKEKSYIDINLPIIFGIFLMLIFLMILALYKLKKEH